MKNPINVIDALSVTTEVVKAVGERYGQHMAQKHELVKINQQHQQERMNMQLMVAGTVAAEAVKLGTSIMAHNQACKRIDAELATATQGHERQLKKLKSKAKHARHKVKAEAGAFAMQMKSFDKDKKSLRKHLEYCTQQSVNFSLTAAERAEAREMAIFLSSQLDNVRHDQLRSQAQLGENLSRVRLGSGGRKVGRVIDGDYEER